MSKLIKKTKIELSVFELQLLKFLDNGWVRLYSEIETVFTDCDTKQIDECLEKFLFNFYIKQSTIHSERAYLTYIMNPDLRNAIKAVQHYKAVQKMETRKKAKKENQTIVATNDLQIIDNQAIAKNDLDGLNELQTEIVKFIKAQYERKANCYIRDLYEKFCNTEPSHLSNELRFLQGEGFITRVARNYEPLFVSERNQNITISQVNEINIKTPIETTEKQTIIATNDLQGTENQAIEKKEPVHYTNIDFKDFQKNKPYKGCDLAYEYAYAICKEFLDAMNIEIEDGEGNKEFSTGNGTKYIATNMLMGSGLLCEVKIVLIEKRTFCSIGKIEMRKCFYENENLNQKHGFTNEFEPVIYQKQIQKKENMNYQRVHITKHDFGKVNLITTKKGDEYKCNDCGCNGFRDGLSPYILIKKNKDMSFCAKAKKEIVLPKKIILISNEAANDFGLAVNSIYDVIPSPTEQYKTDVWVFSPKRNEPIRLLEIEYLGYEGNRTVTDAPTATELPTVTDAPTPKGLIKYKSHEYQDGELLDYVHGIKAENGSFFTLCGIDADGGGSAFETEPLKHNAKIDCPFCKDEFEKSKIELITQEKWFSQDEPTVTIADEPTVTPELQTNEPTVTPELQTNEPTVTITKSDKDDNMIKIALSEMFKTVEKSNSEIYEICNISKSELSDFRKAKRSTSLNRALEIACNLGTVAIFLKTLEGLIKNKVESFTGKKFKVESKQMLLF